MSVPQYKEIQENYTDELNDFLNIEMSSLQIKQWTVALSKFSDDVLKEGWSEFIYKVRPGLMPSIEDCTKIMDTIRMAHSMDRHSALKKDAPTPPNEESVLFTKWMQSTIYGMRMKTEGRWTELDRLEYMLEKAKEVKLPSRDLHSMEVELGTYKRKNPNVKESPI